MRRFGILRIIYFFDVCLTKFKNDQILLNKISHRFLLTAKLFPGRNIIITAVKQVLVQNSVKESTICLIKNVTIV